ncbi:hypothetical protein [Cysteiniphilum marinum]|uniref:hypothetical protein n=1 Tax=Cysteiniphilum marinum TaxID=2774191 RepID=UPI00193B323C|nr:hypothetical protein [Cysteiniphilum marinum]
MIEIASDRVMYDVTHEQSELAALRERGTSERHGGVAFMTILSIMISFDFFAFCSFLGFLGFCFL